MSSDERRVIGKELSAYMKRRGLLEEWDESPGEWVGEFMRNYLFEPEAAKRAAPNTARIIRSLWNSNDVLSRILIFS